MIVTPAPAVPDAIAECVAKGVRGAVVISAGFKEIGAEGKELERRILEEAPEGQDADHRAQLPGGDEPDQRAQRHLRHRHGPPGQGGVHQPERRPVHGHPRLELPRPRRVQRLRLHRLDARRGLGRPHLLPGRTTPTPRASSSTWSRSATRARSSPRPARSRSPSRSSSSRPGRTEAAAKAAASHTGSLTGSDDVLDAAFRRAGVLRVDSIEDLFHMAEVLAKQPRPKGRRLSDRHQRRRPRRAGRRRPDHRRRRAGRALRRDHRGPERDPPRHWSHNNPIDILGDAEPERYAQALELVAKDPDSDGLLVILTPQAMTDPTRTAEELRKYATGLGQAAPGQLDGRRGHRGRRGRS